MTTDEAVQILERYIEWSRCDELDAVPLKDWLAVDIVRLIELMDAELQNRSARFDDAFDIYDFEPAIGEDDV